MTTQYRSRRAYHYEPDDLERGVYRIYGVDLHHVFKFIHTRRAANGKCRRLNRRLRAERVREILMQGLPKVGGGRE